MSCIQAVCKADDAELIKAHKGFHDWKKCNPMDRVKTDYSYALRHYVRYDNHNELTIHNHHDDSLWQMQKSDNEE